MANFCKACVCKTNDHPFKICQMILSNKLYSLQEL